MIVGCNNFSMLGLQFKHISKMDLRSFPKSAESLCHCPRSRYIASLKGYIKMWTGVADCFYDHTSGPNRSNERVWVLFSKIHISSKTTLTDWAIEDQAKITWTRQPVPMISEHSAHSTPLPFGIRTWLWRYTCLLLISMLALTQASDFRIERRHVVFLCWMQGSNPEGLWNQISSRLNARWQTDWAIEDQAKKLELGSPSLWSASMQPTRPHSRLAFAYYISYMWCLAIGSSMQSWIFKGHGW